MQTLLDHDSLSLGPLLEFSSVYRPQQRRNAGNDPLALETPAGTVRWNNAADSPEQACGCLRPSPQIAAMDNSPLQHAQAVGSLTTRRLLHIFRAHNVEPRSLRLLSRNLALINQSSYHLSLTRFTAEVAEPRQRRLAADGADALSDAGRLMLEVLADMAPSSGAQRKVEVVSNFDRSLDLPTDIVRLGDQWHRRLRARALARLATEVAVHPAVPTVDQYRTALLTVADSAPWSFQDRLLTAYEAADRHLLDVHRSLLDQLVEAAATGVLELDLPGRNRAIAAAMGHALH